MEVYITHREANCIVSSLKRLTMLILERRMHEWKERREFDNLTQAHASIPSTLWKKYNNLHWVFMLPSKVTHVMARNSHYMARNSHCKCSNYYSSPCTIPNTLRGLHDRLHWLLMLRSKINLVMDYNSHRKCTSNTCSVGLEIKLFCLRLVEVGATCLT